MKYEAICGYDIHPAASAFPLMPKAELEELAESIRKNGQLQPVVLHDGLVIDGRNRLMACKLAGIDPVTVEWDGEGSLADFVAGANLHRRHLTQDQRALIASKLLLFYEAEAKERQRAAGGDRQSLRTEPEAVSAPGARSGTGKAAEQVADKFKVGARTVERAKFVDSKAPELAQLVLDGGMSLKEAEKQIRNPRAAMNVGGEDDNDVRFTPRTLIEQLHLEHRFTVDAASDASSPAAQVIGTWYTKEDDGLEQDWKDERVWVNPPFSSLPAWVEKAHRSIGDDGAELIVMLMPATRTEQPFWQEFIEPFRDRPGTGVRTRFLPGRTKFGSPVDPEGEASGSPVFGCVLVTWERVEAKAEPKQDVRARVYDREGAVGTVTAPAVDRGDLCGVRPAKNGEACFLKQHHDGVHSNGLTTWSDRKPKAKKPNGLTRAIENYERTKPAAQLAPEGEGAPDFYWRRGSAKNAKVHAYTMKEPDVGLCGANLGTGGGAIRMGDKRCTTCEERARPPQVDDEGEDVIALSEFCRDARTIGFKTKPQPGRTQVEIVCKACNAKLAVKLTEHLDVPKASEEQFHKWAHAGHLHEKPKKRKAAGQ